MFRLKLSGRPLPPRPLTHLHSSFVPQFSELWQVLPRVGGRSSLFSSGDYYGVLVQYAKWLETHRWSSHLGLRGL